VDSGACAVLPACTIREPSVLPENSQARTANYQISPSFNMIRPVSAGGCGRICETCGLMPTSGSTGSLPAMI